MFSLFFSICKKWCIFYAVQYLLVCDIILFSLSVPLSLSHAKRFLGFSFSWEKAGRGFGYSVVHLYQLCRVIALNFNFPFSSTVYVFSSKCLCNSGL